MRIPTYLIIFLCAFCWHLEAKTFEEVLTKDKFKVGVICALPKELGSLAENMEGPIYSKTVGMREYIQGNLWSIETVLATSRVGKVAAASTATHIIENENVDVVIYIGVAGAIADHLKQADVVIGERLIQYDMDSRPLRSQYTIPLINVTEFIADPTLVNIALKASKKYLSRNKVYQGLVGTGDHFVSENSEKARLKKDLPSLLAVDMEGAAVAQICYEYETPFVVIRSISDGSDSNAAVDCMAFLNEIAPVYTKEILQRIYAEINKKVGQAGLEPATNGL